MPRVIGLVERRHKQAVASVGSFDEVYVGVFVAQLSTNAVSKFRISAENAVQRTNTFTT